MPFDFEIVAYLVVVTATTGMSTVKSTSTGTVFQSLCLLAIDPKVKSIYFLFLYLTILFLTVLLYDKETKDKYIGLTFESIACNSTN